MPRQEPSDTSLAITDRAAGPAERLLGKVSALSIAVLVLTVTAALLIIGLVIASGAP